MVNQKLKDYLVSRILHRVQSPGQYIGGEPGAIVKDHSQVRGTLCLAFPDTYALGMSHHGLQVLYALINGLDDWACERVFTPWHDMEQELRQADLPLYSLETFTPLSEFDLLGFTLQYELGAVNVLTMLDLGRVPLRAEDRTMADPLVIAGGPCAHNPEPMSPFIDAFVIGDGEPSLPHVCRLWIDLKDACRSTGRLATGDAGKQQREQMLAKLAAKLSFCYVPRFYRPQQGRGGRPAGVRPIRDDVPETIEPATVTDLNAVPLPTKPIVPMVECVHDRIAVEIMRGCPWQCRFCQSNVIKRPVRFRSVETIVEAAIRSYENTGLNEISLLSLSTSDYPQFEELVRRLHEVFQPLGVNVSVPSLRVNEQLRTMATLLGNRRRSALTLAPEAALDDMREQIGKRISNDDLYEGCRLAFGNNYQSVKLYFMCGLPGERDVDLDGIVEMSEKISRIGKQECGRPAKVTAAVSNFVPKPHTPYQWNAMQRREYFQQAHSDIRHQCRMRSVQIRSHGVDTSLLEGVLSRGDRRTGEAIELAWRNGARLDTWSEHFNAERWWQAIDETGIDLETTIHTPYELEDRLPWDHIGVRRGRAQLEREYCRSLDQLKTM